MKRKTLKQKLKSQLRGVSQLRQAEYELAGITINFELQAMQSVCMAHGVMASMLFAKKVLGEDSPEFKEIESQSQAHIAQCLVKLIKMGVPAEIANQRILQGH